MTPCPASLSNPTSLAEVPAAESAPSTWFCAQEAMFGQHRQDHRRRVTGGSRLKGLRPDHKADIKEDRQNRDERHDRQQQRGEAEEADERDDDPGRERIADPATDRLPSRMADIDRRRKRRPEEAPASAPTSAASSTLRRSNWSPAAPALSTLFILPSVKL